MPSIPSESGSREGNAPKAMTVVVTGIWANSASSRTSAEASEATAPPPT